MLATTFFRWRAPMLLLLHSPWSTPLTQQVVSALFAGFDTTSCTLARVVQLLGSSDSEELVHQLVQELNVHAASDKSALHRGTASSMGSAAHCVLKAFPLLDAIVFEVGRWVQLFVPAVRITPCAWPCNVFPPNLCVHNRSL